jgi:hypothetical protein
MSQWFMNLKFRNIRWRRDSEAAILRAENPDSSLRRGRVSRVATSKVSIFGSHGLVLLHVACQPDCTMREMAAVFGVSERRIARILRDLADAGMISVTKRGKRNVYSINEDAPCRHPTIDGLRLGQVVRAAMPVPEPLAEPPEPARERRAPAGLLHGLLLPFLATDTEGVISLLPAILPMLA